MNNCQSIDVAVGAEDTHVINTLHGKTKKALNSDATIKPHDDAVIKPYGDPTMKSHDYAIIKSYDDVTIKSYGDTAKKYMVMI